MTSFVEAATGDKEVDVRVIDKSAAPCVKDSGNARGGAEPFWIAAEIED